MYADIGAALTKLGELRIVRRDIKPENIVWRRQYTLIDFGAAFIEGNPHRPDTWYAVTRWYRAPAVILGVRTDPSIDWWALACVVFEVHTGTVLFRGAQEIDTLRLIVEELGPIPATYLTGACASKAKLLETRRRAGRVRDGYILFQDHTKRTTFS